MPLAQYIPMACLAGVLVVVSYNMSEWRTFRALMKNPRSDVAVLLVTFLLTVIIDLRWPSKSDWYSPACSSCGA